MLECLRSPAASSQCFRALAHRTLARTRTYRTALSYVPSHATRHRPSKRARIPAHISASERLLSGACGVTSHITLQWPTRPVMCTYPGCDVRHEWTCFAGYVHIPDDDDAWWQGRPMVHGSHVGRGELSVSFGVCMADVELDGYRVNPLCPCAWPGLLDRLSWLR